jgi:4'-phosphopantetheinyl transferase
VSLFTDFIECCFEPETGNKPLYSETETEVYLGITDELSGRQSDYRNVLSDREQQRADQFRNAGERSTYIACHGSLRMVLAKKLGYDPREVRFLNDANNKPFLEENQFYFNISHTMDAFAFVISKPFYSGIDIENTKQNIDIDPIINIALSSKERQILEGNSDLRDKFFRLWTRKEALLKAIGIGIIDELPCIEVSQKMNIIRREVISDLIVSPVYDTHFVYSLKMLDFFISVAVPAETRIKLIMANEIN